MATSLQNFNTKRKKAIKIVPLLFFAPWRFDNEVLECRRNEFRLGGAYGDVAVMIGKDAAEWAIPDDTGRLSERQEGNSDVMCDATEY